MLVATPVALADEVVVVCVVAFPHKLSHDRDGGSSWVFGETGFGSELRRWIGEEGDS